MLTDIDSTYLDTRSYLFRLRQIIIPIPFFALHVVLFNKPVFFLLASAELS